MKIEKLNDNQIRCTLTREDLANREIKLSELAYGTEKAKTLFREMMQQAAQDFGFEVNNIPLMIEAIPVSADSIILIVTKVDNPEELDTRFSRFSIEDEADENRGSAVTETLSGADEILDLIQKINNARQAAAQKSTEAPAAESVSEETVPEISENDEEIFHLTRFYLFNDLETIIRVSKVIGGNYSGTNALFKNEEENGYYLILKKADTNAAQFNKICNILSEYALQVSYTPGMEEYFTEHMEVMIPEQAMAQLARL